MCLRDSNVIIVCSVVHTKQPFFIYLAYKNVHFAIQSPKRYQAAYQATIEPTKRRTYAGMVSAVDESVRNLTQTLQAQGLWNNTVIIFSTGRSERDSYRVQHYTCTTVYI